MSKIKREKAKQLRMNSEKKRPKGYSIIKGSKKKNKIMRVVSVTVTVCIAVIAVVVLGSIAPTGIVEWFKTRTAAVSGSVFPVKYEDSNAKSLFADDNKIYTLTSTDLICYNTKGNKLFQTMHGYAKPVVKTSNMRNLIFNLGANQFRIENASGTVISEKTKSSILCADISDSGVYALTTEGSDDLAEVTVYNKNATAIYRYYSANYYVTEVALSESGKRLCVCAVNCLNAQYVSKVMIYGFGNTEAIVSQEIKDELVYACDFINDDTVRIITDKRVLIFKSNAENKEYSFGSLLLQKYEFGEDGSTLLCLSADANSETAEILVVNRSAQKKCSFTINVDVKAISSNGKNIYVLSEQLFTYSMQGEQTDEKQLKNGAVSVKAVNNAAIVLYASGVEKISQ